MYLRHGPFWWPWSFQTSMFAFPTAQRFSNTNIIISKRFFIFLPGGLILQLPNQLDSFTFCLEELIGYPARNRHGKVCAMTLIMEHSQNSLLVWVTEANREKKRLTRSRFLLRVQNPVANRLYVHEEGIIIWGITSVSSWGQQALVILSSVHQNIVLSQCRKTRSKSGPP